MINMSQRAQLHRILDNCILLSNIDYVIKFELKEKELDVVCENKKNQKTLFVRTYLSNSKFYSDLVSMAESLERELGVDI